MPIVALKEASLTLWRGNDVLQFIDGLSTNKVTELCKGQIIQTIFTDSKAKIIDLVTLFHMGDFIVVAGHYPHLQKLLDHASKRVLDQDVVISDITQRNDLFVEFDGNTDAETIGTFTSQGELTSAAITQNWSLLIASKGNGPTNLVEFDAFNLWRINNIMAWPGYEITDSVHPFSCALDDLVHQQKGCYIGQEILARMRSRGKRGKTLCQVETSTCNPTSITTKGEVKSLAIIR